MSPVLPLATYLTYCPDVVPVPDTLFSCSLYISPDDIISPVEREREREREGLFSPVFSCCVCEVLLSGYVLVRPTPRIPLRTIYTYSTHLYI